MRRNIIAVSREISWGLIIKISQGVTSGFEWADRRLDIRTYAKKEIIISGYWRVIAISLRRIKS